MRRITSACLLQTMRFDTTNDADPEKEFAVYCGKLDRKKTIYVVEETYKEPDGSLIVKIRKQYNTYKTDGYIRIKDGENV